MNKWMLAYMHACNISLTCCKIFAVLQIAYIHSCVNQLSTYMCVCMCACQVCATCCNLKAKPYTIVLEISVHTKVATDREV